MTVLQSDTAEPVRSEYGTVEVVAPGPLGERGRLRSEPLAYVAESAPGTVVLNVVSDLIPCAVTVEEVDAEPDGEPVATVPVMESGPVVVWQPGRNPHRMGVELAPGRYRVWVEVENRERAQQLQEEWDYDTAPEVMPTTERFRVTYLREEQ